MKKLFGFGSKQEKNDDIVLKSNGNLIASYYRSSTNEIITVCENSIQSHLIENKKRLWHHQVKNKKITCSYNLEDLGILCCGYDDGVLRIHQIKIVHSNFRKDLLNEEFVENKIRNLGNHLFSLPKEKEKRVTSLVSPIFKKLLTKKRSTSLESNEIGKKDQVKSQIIESNKMYRSSVNILKDETEQIYSSVKMIKFIPFKCKILCSYENYHKIRLWNLKNRDLEKEIGEEIFNGYNKNEGKFLFFKPNPLSVKKQKNYNVRIKKGKRVVKLKHQYKNYPFERSPFNSPVKEKKKRKNVPEKMSPSKFGNKFMIKNIAHVTTFCVNENESDIKDVRLTVGYADGFVRQFSIETGKPLCQIYDNLKEHDQEGIKEIAYLNKSKYIIFSKAKYSQLNQQNNVNKSTSNQQKNNPIKYYDILYGWDLINDSPFMYDDFNFSKILYDETKDIIFCIDNKSSKLGVFKVILCNISSKGLSNGIKKSSSVEDLFDFKSEKKSDDFSDLSNLNFNNSKKRKRKKIFSSRTLDKDSLKKIRRMKKNKIASLLSGSNYVGQWGKSNFGEENTNGNIKRKLYPVKMYSLNGHKIKSLLYVSNEDLLILNTFKNKVMVKKKIVKDSIKVLKQDMKIAHLSNQMFPLSLIDLSDPNYLLMNKRDFYQKGNYSPKKKDEKKKEKIKKIGSISLTFQNEFLDKKFLNEIILDPKLSLNSKIHKKKNIINLILTGLLENENENKFSNSMEKKLQIINIKDDTNNDTTKRTTEFAMSKQFMNIQTSNQDVINKFLINKEKLLFNFKNYQNYLVKKYSKYISDEEFSNGMKNLEKKFLYELKQKKEIVLKQIQSFEEEFYRKITKIYQKKSEKEKICVKKFDFLKDSFYNQYQILNFKYESLLDKIVTTNMLFTPLTNDFLQKKDSQKSVDSSHQKEKKKSSDVKKEKEKIKKESLIQILQKLQEKKIVKLTKNSVSDIEFLFYEFKIFLKKSNNLFLGINSKENDLIFLKFFNKNLKLKFDLNGKDFPKEKKRLFLKFQIFKSKDFNYIVIKKMKENLLKRIEKEISFINSKKVLNFKTENIIKWIYRLLKILKFLNSKKYYHREIDLNTIYFSFANKVTRDKSKKQYENKQKNEEEQLKVKFFGLMKNLDEKEKVFFNCIMFSAPELILGTIHKNSDIWSIGMLFYFLLNIDTILKKNENKGYFKKGSYNYISLVQFCIDKCSKIAEEDFNYFLKKYYAKSIRKRIYLLPEKFDVNSKIKNKYYDPVNLENMEMLSTSEQQKIDLINDLIQKMLIFLPEGRISVDEALNHELFNKFLNN